MCIRDRCITAQGGSRRRCFPVGLRPPSKHLLREITSMYIIEQYVKEQRYFKSNFVPYGTKLGTRMALNLTASIVPFLKSLISFEKESISCFALIGKVYMILFL